MSVEGKQENCQTVFLAWKTHTCQLVLGGQAQDEIATPTWQILKAHTEALTGVSPMHTVQLVSTALHHLKAMSSGSLWERGRQAECTFQGQERGGEEPPVAPVQLMGQPAVTSS